MANVVRQRHDLERQFRRSLSNAYVVVSSPDHPLLLRAPDLIIGGEGSITAVFIPHAREKSDPSRLKNRLILSRLALPAHAQSVLLVEQNDEELGHSFAPHFLTVETIRHAENLLQLVRAPRNRRRGREVPPETLQTAQLRFAQAMQLTRVLEILHHRETRRVLSLRGRVRERFQVEEGVFEEAGAERRRSSRARRIEPDTPVDQAPEVPLAALSPGRVGAGLVSQLIDEQVGRLYLLDDGVPYGAGASLGVVLVDKLPLMRRDPQKLLRAAAFGGWSFMLNEQRERFQNVLTRIRDFRSRTG